jgi:hypothetical protein
MTQKKGEVVAEKSMKIRELIDYSPMQLIFLIFVVATNIAMVPWIYYSYVFVQKIKSEAPAGYDFPTIYDFKMTAVSSVVFAVS